jgi:hypothetical protein
VSDVQYSLLFETINGTLLAQEQDITVRRTTNSQAVNTVPIGYAGESPGAAMCELDVQNAVPAAGFEYNAGQNMISLTPVKAFTLGPGGQQLKFTGQIISDTLRHGVNNPVTYSFSARGAFVDWS